MFVAGIDEDQAMKFNKQLGVPLGKLPVKYLVVPLITTKLSSDDCQPIIW